MLVVQFNAGDGESAAVKTSVDWEAIVNSSRPCICRGSKS